jgi:hypothetical protein
VPSLRIADRAGSLIVSHSSVIACIQEMGVTVARATPAAISNGQKNLAGCSDPIGLLLRIKEARSMVNGRLGPEAV